MADSQVVRDNFLGKRRIFTLDFVISEGMSESQHEDADGGKPLLAIDDNPIPGILVLPDYCAKEVFLSVAEDYFLEIVKKPGTLLVLPVVIALVYGDEETAIITIIKRIDFTDAAAHGRPFARRKLGGQGYIK